MQDSQKGVILIITFFVTTIIILILMSVSTILFNEIKILQSTRKLISTFYASDSNMEKTLYLNK